MHMSVHACVECIKLAMRERANTRTFQGQRLHSLHLHLIRPRIPITGNSEHDASAINSLMAALLFLSLLSLFGSKKSSSSNTIFLC